MILTFITGGDKMSKLSDVVIGQGGTLTLAERITLIVSELGGPTRAAEVTDVTRQTVANWMSGKTVVGLTDALRLAQAVGVTLDWVATGYMRRPGLGIPSTGADNGFVTVVHYDVNGTGQFVESDNVDNIVVAFKESWLSRLGISVGDAALVLCTDDAMSPTIREGALLLVDRSQTKIVSDGLYVLSRARGFAIRRVQVLIDSSVMLLADNTRYHPEKVDAANVGSISVAGRLRVAIGIF